MQRNTRQRRAIRQVVDTAERPFSLDEILVAAQKIIPRLGQATVYRALNTMQREGILVQVDIPGHPPRYERADLKHHHHFACTDCGKVFELSERYYTGKERVPPGFKAEGHGVIIYGHCRDCHCCRS